VCSLAGWDLSFFLGLTACQPIVLERATHPRHWQRLRDTYTDHYNLSTIQQATGHSYNVVFGTNSDLGNSVIAGRVQDIDPGSTSGYEFALLDPESSLCEFFAFNVGGASSASGLVLFFYGDCQTPVSGTLYNFSGIKY